MIEPAKSRNLHFHQHGQLAVAGNAVHDRLAGPARRLLNVLDHDADPLEPSSGPIIRVLPHELIHVVHRLLTRGDVTSDLPSGQGDHSGTKRMLGVHRRILAPGSRARQPVHREFVRPDDQGCARTNPNEFQSRRDHLLPISVYRWWARRTETVTGAVIDAVNRDHPGRLLIADAFAGGGVIALAALLRGHRVYAQDVNPWAARSLATMLSLPAPDQLAGAGDRLHDVVGDVIDQAYTTALADGTPATVAHTLRVATAACPRCARTLRLFPTALVSLLSRVDCGGDTGYLACPAGHLNLGSATKRTTCTTCRRYVKPAARYTTARTTRCVECGGRASSPYSPTALGWPGRLSWSNAPPAAAARSARRLRPSSQPPTPAGGTRS